MYSIPLETEQDEIEKEKLEKEGLENEDLEKEKEKKETNTTSSIHKKPYIMKNGQFIIGIIICTVALLDMIVLFVVPYQRIQANKRKLPDAIFLKPSKSIIALHFMVHSLVILFGVLLILFSFRECKQIDRSCSKLLLIILGCVIVVWFFAILSGFTDTNSIYPKTTTDELISLLTKNPPINFAFFYSKCEDYQSGTSYSKNGIIFPMKTNITSQIYNFSNTPDTFFVTVEQKVNMSSELKTHFDEVFVDLNSCDRNAVQHVEFYPIIQGDYVVTKGKIPTYLSKGTRIASILFGVGVYYELNFKSIPYIKYIQHLNADIVQGINYDQIFTADTCNYYGKCTHEDKPKPKL